MLSVERWTVNTNQGSIWSGQGEGHHNSKHHDARKPSLASTSFFPFWVDIWNLQRSFEYPTLPGGLTSWRCPLRLPSLHWPHTPQLWNNHRRIFCFICHRYLSFGTEKLSLRLPSLFCFLINDASCCTLRVSRHTSPLALEHLHDFIYYLYTFILVFWKNWYSCATSDTFLTFINHQWILCFICCGHLSFGTEKLSLRLPSLFFLN